MSLEQLKERVTKLESKDDGDIKLFFASWATPKISDSGKTYPLRCLCPGGLPILQETGEAEAAFLERAHAECVERYRAARKKGLQAVWLEDADLDL